MMKKKNIMKYRIKLDIRDYFLNCYDNKGIDFVVVYLAIESFYNLNTRGWEIYDMAYKENSQRFDERRVLESKIIQYERYRNSQIPRIVINEDMQIIEGICDAAISFYFFDYCILCDIVAEKYSIQYDKLWAAETFWPMDCKMVFDKSKELFAMSKTNFIAVLWPPVQDYFDEIEHVMSLFVPVCGSYDLMFHSDEQFIAAIQSAYNIDDSTEHMIDKKICSMSNIKHKKIRIIQCVFKQFDFRFKVVRPDCIDWVERKTVSQSVECIKSLIRKSYKEKIDYYFDNIIHMGDNYYQNKYMGDLFAFIRDFRKSDLQKSLMDNGCYDFDLCWENDFIVGERLSLRTKRLEGIEDIVLIVKSYLGERIDVIKFDDALVLVKQIAGYTMLSIKVRVGMSKDEIFN